MKKFFSALLVASLFVGAMFLTACPVEHVHEFTSEVTEPTCIEGGYTTHTCPCGYAMFDTFTDPTDKAHQYTSAVVDPTCDTDGYTEHTCDICGDYYTTNPTNAGHVWSAWEVIEAPTCDRVGLERRECQNCDFYEENVLSANHPWDLGVVTPADCFNGGYTTYTCTLCGVEKKDNFKKPLTHNFLGTEWVVGKEQTCKETGELHLHCQNEGCDHYDIKVIGKHHYESTVVPPACGTHGYTSYVCKDCGDEIIKDIIDPLGHDWNETADGHKECNACGRVE